MSQEIYNRDDPDNKARHWGWAQGTSGDILVFLVDHAGVRVTAGFILELRADGTMYRNQDITEGYGLQLDVQGRILEVEA